MSSEQSIAQWLPLGAAPGPSDARAADRGESSWLCANAADRERMLDMDQRLAPVRKVALFALAIAALFMSPWLGLWTLVPLAAAGLGFAAGARLSGHSDRPEYALFASWVFS